MRRLKFLRSSSVKAKTPGKQAEQEPSSDALQPLTELSRQPGATEVSKLRSMDQDRRLSLSQAQVSGERDSRLLKRRMVLWGSLALLYFWACASAIAAQQELWSKQGAIGLMGPEASVIVPMLISLWFLGGVFIATRRMVHRPSSKRWFELMLFFNLSVSLSHIIVAVGVVREAFLLGFSVVGNSLPAAGKKNRWLPSTWRPRSAALLHERVRTHGYLLLGCPKKDWQVTWASCVAAPAACLELVHCGVLRLRRRLLLSTFRICCCVSLVTFELYAEFVVAP